MSAATLSPTTHPAIPGPAWDDPDDLGRENETKDKEIARLRREIAGLRSVFRAYGLTESRIDEDLLIRGGLS